MLRVLPVDRLMQSSIRSPGRYNQAALVSPSEHTFPLVAGNYSCIPFAGQAGGGAEQKLGRGNQSRVEPSTMESFGGNGATGRSES